MNALESVYLGNSLQRWLVALAVAVLVFLILRVIKGIAVRRLAKIAERTGTEIDDLILELVSNTKSFFLLFVSLYAGTRILTLTPTAANAARAATVIAALLQAALWGNQVITFSLTRYMQRRMVEDAAAATSIGALRFVGKLILWTVVLLLALDNVGVDITALVAGVGVGGIAVALALQNVLGDLFASLSIVFDKPFVIGDFIIVGDYLGTVEHIGLKTTRVRSLSGEQLIFSNSDLLASRIRNYKRMAERRILFSFGVTYQTPAETLAVIPAMVKEIVEAQEEARFDRAHFKAYGDSALIFEVVYFMLRPDYNAYMDTQQAINLELYRRFQEENIDFAYPTQTLYVQQIG